jgi:hypothetical protein
MNSLPDFHDGFVDGVFLSGSSARIFLRTVKGDRFTLILNELEALRVNDLRKGNVVLEVVFLEPKQLDASVVFELYGYSDEHKKTFALGEWVKEATRKGLTAIEIAPSYGCTILAIFKNHSFSAGHDKLS